jgi:hypothetical protein
MLFLTMVCLTVALACRGAVAFRVFDPALETRVQRAFEGFLAVHEISAVIFGVVSQAVFVIVFSTTLRVSSMIRGTLNG